MDVVLKRISALEATVGQLELQVVKLQNQLNVQTKQIQTAVPKHKKKKKKPDTPKKQGATLPVKAANQQSVPKKQDAKSLVKSAVQQQIKKSPKVPKNHDTGSPTDSVGRLIDLTPLKDDGQSTHSVLQPRLHPPQNKASIASSCAFVKVSGAMGSCQAGNIDTSIDHIAALQLDIDAGDAALWISSSLKKSSAEQSSVTAKADSLKFLEMGVVFRSAHILASSLEFGPVVDSLLLPSAVLDQLEDPNEVPANLYYMTWTYHGCGADGFEQFQSDPAKFDQNDRIMKLYRRILGHRQTIQVWFITDEKHIDDVFAHLKDRCHRELVREWHPCSGHKSNNTETCTSMGQKRRGVVEFLQQSAPSS
ncbi:MAG: hypothetical protein M1830_003573 [Pleopsidium flavum]|nr:MAG: hypothetical protein M1830_003573 [Pleopsidium flavum]